MSRKKFTLADFDKYLKPLHLGGKPQTYTVTHIGVLQQQAREREFVVAGENPEELENAREIIPVLHFREVQKPLRVTQSSNRAKLSEAIGQNDLEMLVGAKLTLASATEKNFGREFIAIKQIVLPKVKADPTPYRTERLQQLRGLRLTEKEMLAALGQEQKPIAPDEIAGMSIEDIEKLIEQTESNLVDLRAARMESNGAGK